VRKKVARRARHGVPMPAQTEAISEGRVTGGRFADGGEEVSATVVMAVGIPPDQELARKAASIGEQWHRVSTTCQTTTDEFMRVGEVSGRHRVQTYGLRSHLFDQAKVAPNTSPEGFAPMTGRVVRQNTEGRASNCLPPAIRAGGGKERCHAGTAPRVTSGSLCAGQGRSSAASLRRPPRRPLYFPASARRHRTFRNARAAGFGRSQLGDGGAIAHEIGRGHGRRFGNCGCNGVCQRYDSSKRSAKRNLQDRPRA